MQIKHAAILGAIAVEGRIYYLEVVVRGSQLQYSAFGSSSVIPADDSRQSEVIIEGIKVHCAAAARSMILKYCRYERAVSVRGTQVESTAVPRGHVATEHYLVSREVVVVDAQIQSPTIN
jgi:hypothetical protein